MEKLPSLLLHDFLNKTSAVGAALLPCTYSPYSKMHMLYHRVWTCMFSAGGTTGYFSLKGKENGGGFHLLPPNAFAI